MSDAFELMNIGKRLGGVIAETIHSELEVVGQQDRTLDASEAVLILALALAELATRWRDETKDAEPND